MPCIHLTSQNLLYPSPVLLLADESVSYVEVSGHELPSDFQFSTFEYNFYQYILFSLLSRKETSPSLQNYSPVLCCGFHLGVYILVSWACPITLSSLFLMALFSSSFLKWSSIWDLKGPSFIVPPQVYGSIFPFIFLPNFFIYFFNFFLSSVDFYSGSVFSRKSSLILVKRLKCSLGLHM